MTKRERLEAIISYYCEGKPTAFAKQIGVAPSTISSWLARDTYDYELLFAKCENISPAWLLTGEGEMLKQAAPAEPIAVPHADELLKERIKMLLSMKGMTIKNLTNDEFAYKRYRNQINGEEYVPYSTIYMLLLMFPDISADWLVMGEGSMKKSDHLAPNIYNTKNEVHDSRAGGDILVGTTTIPYSVKEIIDEKNKRIAELEQDKQLLTSLLTAMTKK